MPPDPDPVAAYLAEVHRELDASAAWGSFGAEDFDWQRHVPRLLAAAEAVHRIAAGWLADAPEVPVIDRDLAGNVIQQILTRELLSKEGSHERDRD